ncbi:MAG TPA: polyphosphate kinase 2 family protein [Acidimicrobiales bacterium]|nr:polyphosphate kinase 2 family protein [Acidimicrobiales bacterium]
MSVDFANIDPASTPDAPGDEAATLAATEALTEKLATLQERLYAEAKQSLLVVLQAMDTGGKDGTIKHVFRIVNPLGVHVASFKQPTPVELAHDFLWRVHAKTPAKGDIVIFNRSHYESVLVERVHDIVPKTVWKQRYDQINAFEQLLVADGTTIVKFFFYISKVEQRQRLLARLDDPKKRWKFNPGDVAERQYWDKYVAAYQDAVNKTNTESAPWYVVPANHKWYRNYVVSKVLVETLERMNPKYPERDVSGVSRDF